MNQNRNKKVIKISIIVIIVLIVCLGLAFAYAFFTTDIFKSNKELFIKYIAQIENSENGFIDDQLKEYFEKQKNTPYTNDGTFNVSIDVPKEEKNVTKVINNMDITFSGQVDNISSKSMQNISINYSENIKLPFSLKKIQNIIGIQTQYIGGKYITIDENKLNNLEISELSIDSLEEKDKLNESLKKDIQSIEEKYLDIINKDLQDSDFSKVEKNGYKLSLSNERIKNITVKLLETLEDDSDTLEKINKYISKYDNSKKINKNNVESIIKELEKEKVEEGNVEITVYQEKGKTSKILIKIQELEIKIEKINENNELKYNISINKVKDEKTEQIAYLNIKYNNLQTLQNVDESYELGIKFTTENDSQEYSYKYVINNKIQFQTTSNVGELTSENSVLLNNLETEQRTNFINAIIQRLTEVNKKQMKELGLSEDENLIMKMLPIYYFQNNTDIENGDLNQDEIAQFNAKFELYQGTNIGGGTVKGLLTVISNNNELENNEENEEETNSNELLNEKKNKKLIKEINFNGEEYEVNKQTIALIKEEISTEDYFRVEFEKDSNSGIIYRAVINKK